MADDTTTTDNKPAETIEEAKPTGEVKGHLLTAEETTSWGNDTRLVEPKSKREDGSVVEDQKDDEKPAEENVEAEPPATAEAEINLPQVTLDDPGEYRPQDYSFTVTTFDEDGKKPKNVKIDSVEKWDELLETDPNLGSAAALLKADRAAAKMEANLERDEATHTAAKEAYDTQVESVGQSEATTQQWANEIDYLAERGDLPKIDTKFENVPWVGANADKEALKDPAVKARIELLEYLRKENASRVSKGLSPMSPTAAFNAMQLDTRLKQDKEAKSKAAEARKAAGARVAGTSPNPTSTAPRGIAIGRAGSLRDLAGGWNNG